MSQALRPIRRPPEVDDPDERGAPLGHDEMLGGRRRLRRAIVLAAVLGIAVLAFALATMIR